MRAHHNDLHVGYVETSTPGSNPVLSRVSTPERRFACHGTSQNFLKPSSLRGRGRGREFGRLSHPALFGVFLTTIRSEIQVF